MRNCLDCMDVGPQLRLCSIFSNQGQYQSVPSRVAVRLGFDPLRSDHRTHLPAPLPLLQILLATGGGHLVLLSVGPDGLQEVSRTQMGSEIACLDITPVGEWALSTFGMNMLHQTSLGSPWAGFRQWWFLVTRNLYLVTVD